MASIAFLLSGEDRKKGLYQLIALAKVFYAELRAGCAAVIVLYD